MSQFNNVPQTGLRGEVNMQIYGLKKTHRQQILRCFGGKIYVFSLSFIFLVMSDKLNLHLTRHYSIDVNLPSKHINMTT